MDLNSSSKEETGFDCLLDNWAPRSCDENAYTADTEPFLSANLRRRLKDWLRKGFKKEDLDYFDDDSSDENEDAADCIGGVHAHGHDSPNSVQ